MRTIFLAVPVLVVIICFSGCGDKEALLKNQQQIEALQKDVSDLRAQIEAEKAGSVLLSANELASIMDVHCCNLEIPAGAEANRVSFFRQIGAGKPVEIASFKTPEPISRALLYLHRSADGKRLTIYYKTDRQSGSFVFSPGKESMPTMQFRCADGLLRQNEFFFQYSSKPDSGKRPGKTLNAGDVGYFCRFSRVASQEKQP